jgi:putative glutathione S-transferase
MRDAGMVVSMGKMISGVWRSDPELDTRDIQVKDGAFVREGASVRGWITQQTAAAGRYHLYIMEGCPWAHRTWLMWKLKGLEQVVSMSMLLRRPGDEGWAFDPDNDRYRDPLDNRRALHEVYAAGVENYTGRVTVPVLFDKSSSKIVNNESADIVRMFNSAFDTITGNTDDYYPEALRPEIDALCERIYRDVNNGVYRAGFAQTRQAHVAARDTVFAALDDLEQRLTGRNALVGDQLTLADWQLFPTLVRFDAAYVSAFHCNTRRLVDYENLTRYMRHLYAQPGVAETVIDPRHYRRGYHSIPFAIGHHDPVPTDAIPLQSYVAEARAAVGHDGRAVDQRSSI